MDYRKNFTYLALLCFIFLFLAMSYNRSDSTLKRIEQDVLSANKLGVYKGDIAIDFELFNQKGEIISLKSYKGKKVIINFFATWCAPCQDEMPTLVELDQRISDESMVLLGVNVTKEEPNRNDVQKFIDHFNVKYNVLFDGEGKVMKEYELIGIPTTLFVDAEGKIIERINGMISFEMIKTHPFFEGVLTAENEKKSK